MAETHFPDGTFAYPQYLTQTEYDQAPKGARQHYLYGKRSGKFRLKDHVWSEFEPLVKEIEELKAAKAELETKHATNRDALTAAAIDDAITASLKAAGVKAAFLRAVALLVRDAHPFTVDTTGGEETVVADTPYGVQTASALVEQFLQSEDGQAYLGKEGLSAQVPSHFAAQLRR